MLAGEAHAALWRCTTEGLRVREFGDEIAVFHEPSVTTHLLEGATAALWRALRDLDHAVGPTELWAACFDGEPDDNELSALSETLGRLQRAGLVQAQPR